MAGRRKRYPPVRRTATIAAASDLERGDQESTFASVRPGSSEAQASKLEVEDGRIAARAHDVPGRIAGARGRRETERAGLAGRELVGALHELYCEMAERPLGSRFSRPTPGLSPS